MLSFFITLLNFIQIWCLLIFEKVLQKNNEEVLQLFCTKFGAKQNPEKNFYKHLNYLEEYYEVLALK